MIKHSKILFSFLTALVLIITSFSTLQKSNADENSYKNQDLKNILGSYSFKDENTITSINISKIIRDTIEEYKIETTTGNSEGCTGEFTGFGIVEKNSIKFKSVENDKCIMTVIPSKNSDSIKIETTEECSYFSGISCGFFGTLNKDK